VTAWTPDACDHAAAGPKDSGQLNSEPIPGMAWRNERSPAGKSTVVCERLMHGGPARRKRSGDAQVRINAPRVATRAAGPAAGSTFRRTHAAPYRDHRRPRARQTPAASRRTRLRHHQSSTRIPALLPARSGQSHPRMEVGLPRLQPQTPPSTRRSPPRGQAPTGDITLLPPFALSLENPIPDLLFPPPIFQPPPDSEISKPTSCQD